MLQSDIDAAKEKFGELIASEQARIERMQSAPESPDFSKMDKIIIGVIPGDGIGPIIMKQAMRVLGNLLAGPLESGRIVLRKITGLSIEERSAINDCLPQDSLDQLKACDVILKGPVTTPKKGDPWPPLPSTVAALRSALDLDVAMRPVRNPVKGIDWVMFRENIEGAYVWGSKGIQVDKDLAVDFVVQTDLQSRSVAKTAFDYARKNGRRHVMAVTKANVVKLTDGNFLKECRAVAEEYPDIEYDEQFVDITASKLGDPEFNENIEVMVLPNLYGDIISDVAAELSGGIGTAGSANIGSKYAVFEAIHGSAPFLINNNRGDYADPSSLFRAVAMLLSHIGYYKESNILNEALDICGYTERRLVITSLREDASTEEYTDYVLETIDRLKAGN